MIRETFREELKENIGHRITVFWTANGQNACSTGVVVEVGWDFVEIRGLVPAFAEGPRQRPDPNDPVMPEASKDGWGHHGICSDRDEFELETVIRLENVTGFVERVPYGHKATVPVCCFTEDPPTS